MMQRCLRLPGLLALACLGLTTAFRCEYCHCEYSNYQSLTVPVPKPKSASDALCAELCPPLHVTPNYCWQDERNGVCESACYNPSDPGACQPKAPSLCSVTKPDTPNCTWHLTKSTGACWGCQTCVCGYDDTNTKTITKKFDKMTDQAMCSQQGVCPRSDTYSSECDFDRSAGGGCAGSCLQGCEQVGEGCPQNCGQDCQCYQNTTSCRCPYHGVKPGYCYQRDHPTSF